AQRRKPTWERVLRADAAERGSVDALRLAGFTRAAWEEWRPVLLAAAPGDGRLLLHDAAPLARYRAMEVLAAVEDAARAGVGAGGLPCPMDAPTQPPRLDDTVVPVITENEWIPLPDAWVANQHRSGGPGPGEQSGEKVA